MILEKDMKLADVILHDYSLVPVVSRFGIKLGFGDKTIEEVCEKQNVELDFFLTILNVFHDPKVLDPKKLQGFPVELLIDYLKNAHVYYLDNKIPEIELLIEEMVDELDGDTEPYFLLQKFFKEYIKELKKHIDREENLVYPYVLKLNSTVSAPSVSTSIMTLIKEYSITLYEEEHDNVEEKLTDLKNIIIKYLPPGRSQKTRFKLLVELSALEKDLHDHSRIEDMILVPMVEMLEKKVLKP